MCPPINHGASLWWCGDSSKDTPCQNVSEGSGKLVNYTGGPVLGLPPITSVKAAASNTRGSSAAAATNGGSSTSPTPSPSPAPKSNDHTATAIGAGVGVPLGIAALGFLAFLFWKASQQRKTSKARDLNAQNEFHQDKSAEVLHSPVARGPPTELDPQGRTVEMSVRPPTPDYRPYRPSQPRS